MASFIRNYPFFYAGRLGAGWS